VRPAINVATGGLGNIPASIGEQATSTVVSVLSVIIPAVIFTILVIVLTIIFLWLPNRKKKKDRETE
jgi:uncharacterized membrane protein YfcA